MQCAVALRPRYIRRGKEETCQDHPGARPGDHQLARHRLRRATASIAPCAQQEFRQIFPQPGWVEHDPEEIWATQLARGARGAREGRARRRRHRRDRHHQPARDRRCSGTARPAQPIAQRDRLAGPAHRRAVRAPARAPGTSAASASSTGLVLDPYFSGTKIALAARQRAGRARARRRGELAFGTIDSWLVWKLTGGARARHRRHQRLAHAAVRHPRAATGTTSCCGCSACRARCCPRSSRRARCYGDDAGRARRRRCRSPASRAISRRRCSARLLRARQGEEHLRHRLLHADEHGDAAASHRSTGCSPRRVAARRRQPSTRSRAACSSAARRCSGCATGWHHRASAEVEELARERAGQRRRRISCPAFAGLGAPHWDPYARGAILGHHARHDRRAPRARRARRHRVPGRPTSSTR